MMPMVPSNPMAVSTTIDSSKRIKLTPPIKPENRVPLVIDTSDNNHSNRVSSVSPCWLPACTKLMLYIIDTFPHRT